MYINLNLNPTKSNYHNDYRGNYRENKERMSDHEIDQIRRIVNQM